jgi:hypothetical protein
MAQLSEPRTASRRPAPIQQRTALAGCSVWRRIIAQMSDTLRRPLASKNLPPKMLEMPILPHYFAFRDRN